MQKNLREDRAASDLHICHCRNTTLLPCRRGHNVCRAPRFGSVLCRARDRNRMGRCSVRRECQILLYRSASSVVVGVGVRLWVGHARQVDQLRSILLLLLLSQTVVVVLLSFAHLSIRRCSFGQTFCFCSWSPSCPIGLLLRLQLVPGLRCIWFQRCP